MNTDHVKTLSIKTTPGLGFNLEVSGVSRPQVRGVNLEVPGSCRVRREAVSSLQLRGGLRLQSSPSGSNLSLG